ncbi:prolipoprotein diacylglyceryl transferase [Anaerocolumna sp.]|uniref:prolipoprotein diacylglyceryl transferase n=1 Tax=Anaerocolumna sp. TaxID=2041569 RepID=UPI0028A5C05A|nr:prolipoprotein diacylglyceryl transferase [Anaerocolumna sp.]
MVYNAATSIKFPNLGIEFNNLGSSIDVFGFKIAYYGIVIALGMAAGYLVAQWQAKRTKQNPDLYLDFALYAIILSVIGARLFYVIFSWDEFRDDPIQILNIRQGGLAIYGGIIVAVITAWIYSKIKKMSFGLLADTACLGLVTGQIIGRWGNFFNREVFGKYTNGLFSMLLDIRDVGYDYTSPVSYITEKYADKPDMLNRILEIRENPVVINGITYIQVHPTFLYESLWNLMVLILLILYSKHKKFNGEVFILYLAGYGLGRAWIEGIRSDQLFLWGTPFAVSQVLSALLVIVAIAIIIIRRRQLRKNVR